jgi:hypothetical protein
MSDNLSKPKTPYVPPICDVCGKPRGDCEVWVFYSDGFKAHAKCDETVSSKFQSLNMRLDLVLTDD